MSPQSTQKILVTKESFLEMERTSSTCWDISQSFPIALLSCALQTSVLSIFLRWVKFNKGCQSRCEIFLLSCILAEFASRPRSDDPDQVPVILTTFSSSTTIYDPNTRIGTNCKESHHYQQSINFSIVNIYRAVPDIPCQCKNKWIFGCWFVYIF